MTELFKYLYYKLTPGRSRWYPLLGVYYLTYQCRFRCPYCSDGSGTPYYQIGAPVPSGDDAIRYIQKIRTFCNYLVITGGEPTEHPEFLKVLKHIPAMKFKQVILTTNGDDVEPYLPALGEAVDLLIFSLDTLNAQKADPWFGVGPGSLQRIMENIDKAHRYNPKSYSIGISAVVTPANIEDLYGVYQYARQFRYEFAAAPQLIGVKAHPQLVDNPAYRQFYDFLIQQKRVGGPVFGTPWYLEYMRDLKKFRCYPFTMLVVAPGGDVFYPCLEIGNHCGHIMETKTLHQLRQQGEVLWGPQPHCDNRCHSACALAFALSLRNPLPFIYEQMLSYLRN